MSGEADKQVPQALGIPTPSGTTPVPGNPQQPKLQSQDRDRVPPPIPSSDSEPLGTPRAEPPALPTVGPGKPNPALENTGIIQKISNWITGTTSAVNPATGEKLRTNVMPSEQPAVAPKFSLSQGPPPEPKAPKQQEVVKPPKANVPTVQAPQAPQTPESLKKKRTQFIENYEMQGVGAQIQEQKSPAKETSSIQAPSVKEMLSSAQRPTGGPQAPNLPSAARKPHKITQSISKPSVEPTSKVPVVEPLAPAATTAPEPVTPLQPETSPVIEPPVATPPSAIPSAVPESRRMESMVTRPINVPHPTSKEIQTPPAEPVKAKEVETPEQRERRKKETTTISKPDDLAGAVGASAAVPFKPASPESIISKPSKDIQPPVLPVEPEVPAVAQASDPVAKEPLAATPDIFPEAETQPVETQPVEEIPPAVSDPSEPPKPQVIEAADKPSEESSEILNTPAWATDTIKLPKSALPAQTPPTTSVPLSAIPGNTPPEPEPSQETPAEVSQEPQKQVPAPLKPKKVEPQSTSTSEAPPTIIMPRRDRTGEAASAKGTPGIPTVPRKEPRRTQSISMPEEVIEESKRVDETKAVAEATAKPSVPVVERPAAKSVEPPKLTPPIKGAAVDPRLPITPPSKPFAPKTPETAIKSEKPVMPSTNPMLDIPTGTKGLKPSLTAKDTEKKDPNKDDQQGKPLDFKAPAEMAPVINKPQVAGADSKGDVSGSGLGFKVPTSALQSSAVRVTSKRDSDQALAKGRVDQPPAPKAEPPKTPQLSPVSPELKVSGKKTTPPPLPPEAKDASLSATPQPTEGTTTRETAPETGDDVTPTPMGFLSSLVARVLPRKRKKSAQQPPKPAPKAAIPQLPAASLKKSVEKPTAASPIPVGTAPEKEVSKDAAKLETKVDQPKAPELAEAKKDSKPEIAPKTPQAITERRPVSDRKEEPKPEATSEQLKRAADAVSKLPLAPKLPGNAPKPKASEAKASEAQLLKKDKKPPEPKEAPKSRGGRQLPSALAKRAALRKAGVDPASQRVSSAPKTPPEKPISPSSAAKNFTKAPTPGKKVDKASAPEVTKETKKTPEAKKVDSVPAPSAPKALSKAGMLEGTSSASTPGPTPPKGIKFPKSPPTKVAAAKARQQDEPTFGKKRDISGYVEETKEDQQPEASVPSLNKPSAPAKEQKLAKDKAPSKPNKPALPEAPTLLDTKKATKSPSMPELPVISAPPELPKAPQPPKKVDEKISVKQVVSEDAPLPSAEPPIPAPAKRKLSELAAPTPQESKELKVETGKPEAKEEKVELKVGSQPKPTAKKKSKLGLPSVPFFGKKKTKQEPSTEESSKAAQPKEPKARKEGEVPESVESPRARPKAGSRIGAWAKVSRDKGKQKPEAKAPTASTPAKTFATKGTPSESAKTAKESGPSLPLKRSLVPGSGAPRKRPTKEFTSTKAKVKVDPPKELNLPIGKKAGEAPGERPNKQAKPAHKRKAKVSLPPKDNEKTKESSIPVWVWPVGLLALIVLIVGVGITAYYASRETRITVRVNPGSELTAEAKLFFVHTLEPQISGIRRDFHARRKPILEAIDKAKGNLNGAKSDLKRRESSLRTLQDQIERDQEEIPRLLKGNQRDLQRLYNEEGSALDKEYNDFKESLHQEIASRAQQLKLNYSRNPEIDAIEVAVNAFRLSLYGAATDENTKVDVQRTWAEEVLQRWHDFKRDWEKRQLELRDRAMSIKSKPVPVIEQTKQRIDSQLREVAAIKAEIQALEGEVSRYDSELVKVDRQLEDVRRQFYQDLIEVPAEARILGPIEILPDGTADIRKVHEILDGDKTPLLKDGQQIIMVEATRTGEAQKYWALKKFNLESWTTHDVKIDETDFVPVIDRLGE